MAFVLVAEDVCRFTVHGTYGGRPVANIIDMAITNLGLTTSRLDAIEDQAAIIVSAWADEVLDRVVDEYAAQSVSWLDLDSETGSTGETSVGTGTDFPANGGSNDSPAPGNVAMRVLKNTVAQRGQRQGRMYLCGLPEAFTANGAPNTIAAGQIAGFNTSLANFLAAINQDGGVTDPVYDSRMCVLHVTSELVGDERIYTYEGRSNVESLTIDTTLSSQRRRLRG